MRDSRSAPTADAAGHPASLVVSRVRVLLAEDHALVRAGIRSLLAGVDEIEVVGEASDGEEAITLAGDLLPDVVVMDVSMPGYGGFEALARLTAEYPSVRVIMLSMHDREEYVWEALRAGAAGYVLKDSSLEELEFAILSVARGGTFLTPSLTRHVLAGYVRLSDPVRRGTERLTVRQREIVRQIAAGRSNREIAHALGLSTKTVESHRSEAMNRLGIHDVAGIVRYAVRAGLVESDE
jgi:DNA-binding NarL/FixJ family response regulator